MILERRTDHIPTVQKTAAHVRSLFEGEGTGHDWWHVERVWKNALYIAKGEGGDLFVVELAALLHDIADWKFHGGDESVGPQKARAWLESLAVDGATIAHVCEIIADISFKGAGETKRMPTLEGMIVQDADRLDALGAIGIARAFAYGGHKGNPLHNPGEQPQHHETFEQYKKGRGSTVNHFYEKLLLLKNMMNTETAREMAAERHRYMEEYLRQFFLEWDARR